MKPPHILLLNKNVVELKKHLAGILSKDSASAFDTAVQHNVIQLFKLGEHHYTFAQAIAAQYWRQIVSRSYYAAYNISKAVRLAVNGSYSQEVKDHEKVGDLPDDFPNKNIYANKLRLLRDDRNLCDYDHTAVQAELGSTSADTLQLVSDLIGDAKKYLGARNVRV